MNAHISIIIAFAFLSGCGFSQKKQGESDKLVLALTGHVLF
jgi:hypothetical protein